MVAFLAVMVGQVATKVEPDVYMMYAGRYYINPSSYDTIQKTVADLINSDYNNDGAVEVEIINKTIKTKEVNEKQEEESGEELYTGNMAEALSAFRTEIGAGQSVILFLDVLLYNDIVDEQRLMSLEDVLGYKPEGAIDDYGIYLKDTPFAEACEEFKSLGDTTIVCVKRRVLTCDKQIYQNNLDAFKKLFD